MMGKSFADWTQEIAESNNHEPEPERCGQYDKPLYGAPYNPPPKVRPEFADEDTDQHIACSGNGCGKYGAPNYSSNGWDVDQFYCNGSPRCCP